MDEASRQQSGVLMWSTWLCLDPATTLSAHSGVQPIAEVRARAGEPAAAGRLRHGAVPRPHELDQ